MVAQDIPRVDQPDNGTPVEKVSEDGRKANHGVMEICLSEFYDPQGLWSWRQDCSGDRFGGNRVCWSRLGIPNKTIVGGGGRRALGVSSSRRTPQMVVRSLAGEGGIHYSMSLK